MLLKPYFKILLITFSILIFKIGEAQNNYRFHHYKTEQGLSNNIVNCIIQDQKGFLWIGTQDGLNRFDGYSIKQFRFDKNDTTSISGNYITGFYIDGENNLWISTDGGGINRYDHIKQKFIRYKVDKKNPISISSNNIKSICGDEEGNLWLATRDEGLMYFNLKEKKFYQYNTRNSELPSNEIRSICLDSKKRLWIGTYDDGISVFNTNTGEFRNYKYNPKNKGSLPDNSVNHIFESRDGTIWIGTYSFGLCSYDENNDKFLSYYDPSGVDGIRTKSAKYIFEDSEGLLWIGTWSYGLYTFNRKTNKFKNFIENQDIPFQISDSRVLSIYEDNSGQMWFGTYLGLNRLDKFQTAITYYVHDKNNPNSLSDNKVYSLLESQDGNVWIGTYKGGLDRFDRKTGKFYHYKADINNPNNLIKNTIWDIFEDSKGRVWIGNTGGILMYNPEEDNFIRHLGMNHDKNGIPAHNFLSIRESSEGKLWLRTWGEGIVRYDPITKESTKYPIINENKGIISGNEINNINIGHKSQLWVGTESGLYFFHEKNKKFEKIKFNKADKNILDYRVNTIHKGLSGKLWIGTDIGLKLYNWQDSTLNHVHIPEIKNEVAIRNILEDANNCLWLNTVNGLGKYDISEKTLIWFDKQDGFQENLFSYETMIEGKSGRIYTGTTNGYNEFFPDKLKQNTHIPGIVITKFLLFNKEIKIDEKTPLKADLNYHPEIILNHTDNVFSFEFSALNFSQPENNQYAYMLEGVHDDWIYTDYKYRRATFTQLRPGTYTFRVKASNNDGFWNEEGISVKVTILPPWWKTWWASTMWITLVVGSILSAYIARINILKQQKKKLELQVKERTGQIVEKNNTLETQKNELANINKAKDNMFAIIGHDLRGPVGNLISMLDMLTDEGFDFNEEEIKQMLEVLSDSAKSAFNLLENLLTWSQSQRNIIKYSPETIKLNKVIQLDINLLKPAAANKNISLISKIDEEITVFADNNMMKTVFRNLISNAIKFTNQNGKIEVFANPNNGIVEVYIRDNGIGIPNDIVQKLFNPLEHVTTKGTENEKGSGLGLMLCKELIERNKGTIRVESKINKGSTFIITIPSKKT